MKEAYGDEDAPDPEVVKEAFANAKRHEEAGEEDMQASTPSISTPTPISTLCPSYPCRLST